MTPCRPARQIDDQILARAKQKTEFTFVRDRRAGGSNLDGGQEVEVLPGVRQAFWNAGEDG